MCACELVVHIQPFEEIDTSASLVGTEYSKHTHWPLQLAQVIMILSCPL